MRISLLLLMAACTAENKPVVLTPTTTPNSSPAANPAPAKALPTNEEILSLAQEYTKWGRVDESPGFAPLDCRAPTEEASQARQSMATQEHGQKLYFLFAKKKDNYFNLSQTKKIDHTGQVIVKESWTSKEIKESELPRRVFTMDAGPPPPITHTAPKNGVALQTDQPAPLFLMIYVGKEQKESDNGWWYATVSPDKKTVTASGVIASCQGCHSKAQYDGLFGLASP